MPISTWFQSYDDVLISKESQRCLVGHVYLLAPSPTLVLYRQIRNHNQGKDLWFEPMTINWSLNDWKAQLCPGNHNIDRLLECSLLTHLTNLYIYECLKHVQMVYWNSKCVIIYMSNTNGLDDYFKDESRWYNHAKFTFLRTCASHFILHAN